MFKAYSGQKADMTSERTIRTSSSTVEPISILIAEEECLTRQLICYLLKDHPLSRIVGQASDGLTAVRLAIELKPDMVLSDMMMPGLEGLEVTREILRQMPTCKIIALSAYAQPKKISDMKDAGSRGFVSKFALITELQTAIETVSTGGTYFMSPMQDDTDEIDLTRSPLTPRQGEIVRLIVAGKRSREIAEILGIALDTVLGHRRQIHSKLAISNVTELVNYAIRTGIC